MTQRVYRAPLEYWLLSTIVVVALLLIPVVVIGGIPGFPHFAEGAAKWQRIYATRPYHALTLAFVWAATAIGFSYVAIKALLRLLSPRSLRGILEQVDATEAATKRTGWIRVSGIKRSLRYEKGVFDLLDRQRTANATVDIRVGVGDRVVVVDVVKSP
jgi:hypothetical protein